MNEKKQNKVLKWIKKTSYSTCNDGTWWSDSCHSTYTRCK